MAAVLCNGICNLCDVICCKAPCKCCDVVCSSPCKLCGCVFNSPLSGYVIITVLVQAPSIIYGINGILQSLSGDDCTGDKNFIWLIGSIITSIIHIVAAVYLLVRIRNASDADLSDYASGFDRASHLLCRDVCMAIYILVFIFFFVWLIWGSSWIYYYDTSPCIDETVLMTVLALDWSYFVVGPLALTCSLCCTACCDGRDYAENNNTNNGRMNNNNSVGDPVVPASAGFEVIADNNNGTNTGEKKENGMEVPMAYAEVVPTAPPTNYDTNNNTKNTTTTMSDNNNNDLNDTVRNATQAVSDGIQDTWNMMRTKLNNIQQKK